MDLIIKNLEKLQDYHTKEGKHPIEKLVLDFDKLSEMKDFTKIFEESCEKYNDTPNWEPVKSCGSCKYQTPGIIEPCGSCITMGKDNYYPYYEPAEPNLKEATERMQRDRKSVV